MLFCTDVIDRLSYLYETLFMFPAGRTDIKVSSNPQDYRLLPFLPQHVLALSLLY